MNILILGGGLQGLSTGASLYKKGGILDIVSDNLRIQRSKFFRKVYSGVSSCDESVYDILRRTQYDVVIPMGDKNVAFLSKNRAYIEKEFGCKCACPDYETLSTVEDKHKFMAFCDENNIPHPVTKVLTQDTMEDCAVAVGFPALIKPDFSVGARGITRVNSLEELKEKSHAVSEKYGACTLQEFIDNKEYYYNVMLYRNKEGEFAASAIIKIVRMYPVNAGSSSCCISVENEELLEICKDCLDKLNWVGMADFDVLQRLDNGEYKIIEINARVPASLRGAAISGINFPEVIALDAVGMRTARYEYRPGKTMRYMGLDLMWFMKSPCRWNSRPSWFRFFAKDLYYQDIYASDISTWWTWIVEGIWKIRKKNKRVR